MSTALIFGINSPVAVSLCLKLLSKGIDVYGIYNKSIERIPTGISCFKFNELNRFQKNPEYVFIIGAYVPRGHYNEPSLNYITSNIDTVSILCKKFVASKIVFCSSVSVHGQYFDVISEESPYINPCLYGLSKLSGELIVKQVPAYAICRFSSIYGPGVPPNNFINRCIHQAKNDKEISLWGDGTREQNYLFVDDSAEWLIRAAFSNDNRVFLCGGETSVSNDFVANTVSLVLNVPIVYTSASEERSYYLDNKASKQYLNFLSKTSIEKGIFKCLATV